MENVNATKIVFFKGKQNRQSLARLPKKKKRWLKSIKYEINEEILQPIPQKC